MPKQLHELHITNFFDTGLTTAFSRYTFTVRIEWENDAGQLQTHGPTSYTFPNALSDMPLRVRRAFAEQMITAAVRVALGLNTWDDYA